VTFRGIPRRLSLLVFVLTLAVALVLGFAPSAQAANLVQNPSFEAACGTAPCQWTASPGASILRIPNTPHSGTASMRVISAGTTSIVQARSDCFVQPVSAGTTYNLLVWYRVAPPVVVSQITYAGTFFSGVGCTGSSTAPAGASSSSPMIDGLWHPISGQSTVPSGMPFVAVSARVQLNFTCSGTCSNTQAVDYDDVVFDSSPLAVTIHSLSARRSRDGVVVRWRTGTEADTLGFNLYRQSGAKRVRLNGRLLPSLGGLGGSSYSYRDRRAPRRAVRYWVQDVSVHGTRGWHGPVGVRGS
jgi:hypothetical protein